MRRPMLLATLLAVGLLFFAGSTTTAQPVDPYPALSRGAVDFAAMSAAGEAGGASDLYLTQIFDYGGATFGFTLDQGQSAAWGYHFYSPLRDSTYRVIVSGQANTVFGLLYADAIPSPDTSMPLALDTSGAFAQSAKLAELIRTNPEYQRFVSEHPDLTAMSVGMVASVADFPYAPAGFPTNESIWFMRTGIWGDSLHACVLGTTSGTFACGEYFNLSVPMSLGISQASGTRFGVSNFGLFGTDYTGQQPAAGLEAPEGSGNAYIYGAGLWFGARKRIDGALQPRVFITYDPNSGESWATPGDGYEPRTSYSAPVLQNARGHDPATGEPVLEGGFRWPLWVVSPDTGATMMDPGTFVGLNTNRVAGGANLRPAYVAIAEEQHVARYHDSVLARYIGNTDLDGFPLGLQIQENIFAEPGGLDHTVILSYEIVNRSDDTLFDAVAGMITDFDIGTATNDRSRFYSERPELRTAIAWGGAEGARPTPYGLLVMTLLEAPVTAEGGAIDESRRAEFRTAGEVGTYQTWTIETDPSGSAARYAFLTSGEKDGDTRAADLRGALASETFTMLPGDTAHFAIAYIVNRDRAAITGADAALETRITNVINAYYGLQFSGIRASESAGGELSLAAAPNPARDAVSLRMELAKGGDASIEVFDHLGARVLAQDLGRLDAGRSIRSIDVAGLASGAYVVVARCGDARVSVPLVIAR